MGCGEVVEHKIVYAEVLVGEEYAEEEFFDLGVDVVYGDVDLSCLCGGLGVIEAFSCGNLTAVVDVLLEGERGGEEVVGEVESHLRSGAIGVEDISEDRGGGGE